MELTLRKARRIERNINPSILSTVVVRTYDSNLTLEDLAEGVEATTNSMSDGLTLLDIRHDINFRINQANMQSGVSRLLNRRDCLFKKKDFLSKLPIKDFDEDQLEFCRGRTTDVSLNSVRETHEDLRNNTIRVYDEELRGIADELDSINSTQTITLTDTEVTWLKDEGIL